MDVNRRGFLSALAGFAATAVLDPEKLLCRPGAKKVFIPTRPGESVYIPAGTYSVTYTGSGTMLELLCVPHLPAHPGTPIGSYDLLWLTPPKARAE